MTLPAEWPPELVEPLSERFGSPRGVVTSNGMSVARVWRAEFEQGRAIVKTSPRGREREFYERVAPLLRDHGVGIPELYASARAEDWHWLAIEFLEPFDAPGPPPDGRAIEVLARLHRATRQSDIPMEPARFGAWRRGDTAAALTWFDSDVAGELRPLLKRLEREAVSPPDPWCWISGDPSPPNWGLRGEEAALFDWELFRPGVPATDLAIVLPGFPAPLDFERAAGLYLDACSASSFAAPGDAAGLARDMAVAKLGTMVVLLAAQATRRANVSGDYVRRLVASLPAWVESLRL